MQKYNKFLIALAGVALSALSFYFSDAAWLPFVIQAAAALGVYATPNQKS